MSAVARIPTSPMSVTSLIASMGMIAVGNGFLFAFIPLKLASAGFAPWVAGAMITAMSLGGVAGCFLTAISCDGLGTRGCSRPTRRW